MSRAIQRFDSWAKTNKDEGMQKNHAFSVNKMLKLIPKNISQKAFTFIDIGCGNGWVVRQIKQTPNCVKSVGIDGSKNMIQKALKIDNHTDYLNLDIETMEYKEKFDVVFSMEVFYYFKDPFKVLKYIHTHILKPDGCMILGLDHYLENKPSLSWEKDLHLNLQTLSIDVWKNKIKEIGFTNLKTCQFGKKEDWEGTLVIYAEK